MSETAVRSSVKARAEARRRRILESSSNRLGIVSGEKPQGDNVNETKEEEITQVEETTENSSAKVSRMQQMRRRRFNKNAPPKTESLNKSEPLKTESLNKSEPPETESLNKSELPKAESDGIPESTNKASYNLSELPKKSESVPENRVGEEVRDGSKEVEPKKKYMGVARMRRKILAEKKIKEAKDNKSKHLPKNLSKNKPPTRNLPLMMNLVVTCILFITGVYIGLQQQGFVVSENIRHGLSFKDGRLGSFLKKEESSKIETFSEMEFSKQVFEEEFEEDEFEPIISQPKNVDPIFRVDLDELTEGPNFFHKLARIAVWIHRCLCNVFIFYPIASMKSVLMIPYRIISIKCYPYIFCFSVFMRKTSILVGGPIILEDGSETSGVSKDLLTMGIKALQEFLKNFIPGVSFVLSLWTLFKEAREDMMIVLFGLFVGLAFPLQFRNVVSFENEEL